MFPRSVSYWKNSGSYCTSSVANRFGPPTGAVAGSNCMSKLGSATCRAGRPLRVSAPASSAAVTNSRCVSICCWRNTGSVTPPTAAAASTDGPLGWNVVPVSCETAVTAGWAAGPDAAPDGLTKSFITIARRLSMSLGKFNRRAAIAASCKLKSVRP